MKLNIGCGKHWHGYHQDGVFYGRKQGYDGVDIVDHGQQFVCDVTKGMPMIGDDKVTHIICHNFLEHMAPGDELIAVMNEFYRVMKPGGKLDIIVPRFPHTNSIADPTHKSFWHEKSFEYWAGKRPRSADYGIKKWGIENRPVPGGEEGDSEYTWTIAKDHIRVVLVK